MNPEHVLVIDGNNKTPVSLDRGALLSTQSLYEFSTIIWVVDGLANELASQTHQGLLDQELGQRTGELRAWVEEGHCLIVVGPLATVVSH
jgi:hypothetical protein